MWLRCGGHVRKYHARIEVVADGHMTWVRVYTMLQHDAELVCATARVTYDAQCSVSAMARCMRAQQ